MTAAQLQAILSAGGQPTGTAASLPTATLEDRIAAAEQAVDAKLAVAGYTVPLLRADGKPPPLVVELTGAVAAYLADLVYRRGKAHESDLAPVLQRYRWATTTLADIGTRLLLVPGVVRDVAARGTGGVAVEAVESYQGRMFGPGIADVGARYAHPDWWY